MYYKYYGGKMGTFRNARKTGPNTVVIPKEEVNIEEIKIEEVNIEEIKIEEDKEQKNFIVKKHNKRGKKTSTQDNQLGGK